MYVCSLESQKFLQSLWWKKAVLLLPFPSKKNHFSTLFDIHLYSLKETITSWFFVFTYKHYQFTFHLEGEKLPFTTHLPILLNCDIG